jgi:DNA-binding NarL/FixJ family response regulator
LAEDHRRRTLHHGTHQEIASARLLLGDQAGEVERERERERIRVLLVDDNARFRKNFVLLLEQQPDTEVVAQEAGSLAEARKMLSGVDVALIDRWLPDGDGLDLIGELREASPGARVLAMSLTMEEMYTQKARAAGADGVLDKIAPPDKIAAQIRAMREGVRRWPNGHVGNRELEGAWQRYLATEREALLLRANGLLAHTLLGMPPGESREDLQRIASEDERLAKDLSSCLARTARSPTSTWTTLPPMTCPQGGGPRLRWWVC